MDSPLLSIGMIVKNEIRCIERCMESLMPLRDAIPCQLVIADTGSSDGTREVVEKYADIVFDFSWNNDFSAARNAVLDRCTGEWFLSIDADEWLKDVTPLVDFLSSKHQKKYNKAMCIARNYTDENLSNYGDFYVARMGRRRGGKLQFQFPIHEHMYYTDGLTGPVTALPKVILHHDGYVNASSQRMKEKRHRNMVLLREELRENPNDLRILVHALQSAEDEEELQEYMERALQLAPTQPKNSYSSVTYQNTSYIYMKKGQNRKVIDCYNDWKKIWPLSPVLEVDGEAVAAAAEYALEHDEEALEHIKCWRKGVCRAERGEDINSSDRLVTQYYMDSDSWRGKLACIEVQCLLRLQRYDDADRAIQNIDLRWVEATNRVALLKLIFQNAENLSSADVLLKKCWDLCIPPVEESKDEETERLSWKKDFVSIIGSWMRQDEGKTLSLISGLNDSPLGVSAQIITSYNPFEIAKLWEQVDDWGNILPQAYVHTMELSFPFPDSFYHQMPGCLRNLVESLAQNISDFAFRIARLKLLPADTLIKQQFQYDLTTAALQMLTPLREAGENELCQTLCSRLSGIAQDMFPKIYHPDLLRTRENWGVLAGMHQFGLWLCTAEQSKKSGDMIGFIRALRQGLQVAPLMKEMVEFLLEQAEKEEKRSMAKRDASPELLNLAEQVRKIISQYPPDDPAIEAIKQSDAYRKVAYLIEGMEVPILGGLPQ